MNIIKAKISNPKRLDAPSVEIVFPVKAYEDTYRRLANIGIGDPIERDCRITEISGPFEVLTALRGQEVNVDELDYLAKRLDSFMEPEVRQFEGMATAKGITGIEDFINLTLCCQQATVISDFSDLRAIGREHYLNTHGGSAPISILDALDTEQEARNLILNQTGTVTPYGVAYDNGMELERRYKGQEFPAYLYDHSVLAVELTGKSEPGTKSTWLPLPMPEVCLERALARGGFGASSDMSIELEAISVSSDIFRWIDPSAETPENLNNMAAAIAELDDGDTVKLCAAAEYAEPGSANALWTLVDRLDLFDFCPDVSTPEQYGRYMIVKSGHFEYDAELDEYYDFERYGRWRFDNEQGEFIEAGYIRYMGDTPLETLFSEQENSPGQNMMMGGI